MCIGYLSYTRNQSGQEKLGWTLLRLTAWHEARKGCHYGTKRHLPIQSNSRPEPGFEQSPKDQNTHKSSQERVERSYVIFLRETQSY